MFLYSAVCYFITVLAPTSSYVLLAANIEDFRSLAKQFVPDNMADDILEMAKDAIGSDSTLKPHSYPKFHHEEEADDGDSEVTIRSYKQKRGNKDRFSKRTTSRYELSLDDLVEKVKDRLQSELTQMAVTAAKTKILLQSKEKKSARNPSREPAQPNDSSEVQASKQQRRPHNLPSRDIENIRDNAERKPQQTHRKEKSKRQTVDDKYVAEVFEAQPPKYLYDLGKPVTLQQSITPRPEKVTLQENISSRPQRNKIQSNQHQVNNNQNIKREREFTQPKHITTTTTGGFIGVDMAQINDSYEDYEVPKKDKDFFSVETQTNQKTVKKDLKIISDDYETTRKAKNDQNYEDETTNYNKKKKNEGMMHKNENNKYFKQRPSNKDEERSVVPFAAGNSEPRIQPYAEQLQETYADDTEEPNTEEPKARSASISLNEYTVSQYLSPQVVKNEESNRNKKVKKPKRATIIPKRDMYKLTSPNYVVKMPIIGEKYRFDEPIPEKDREPENLEPVGNVQGLINGKLLV